MSARNEKIKFRYLVMPCCNTQLCWVNPRLPTYCPECSQHVLTALRTEPDKHILVTDDNAWIRYSQ
jgi:hypothetical protein